MIYLAEQIVHVDLGIDFQKFDITYNENEPITYQRIDRDFQRILQSVVDNAQWVPGNGTKILNDAMCTQKYVVVKNKEDDNGVEDSLYQPEFILKNLLTALHACQIACDEDESSEAKNDLINAAESAAKMIGEMRPELRGIVNKSIPIHV